MSFPNHEVTIDLENIQRRIYAYAREQATRDEATGVDVGPFKVELSAPTGYAVADILDYDTQQDRRNGKVRIVVNDAASVKADIAEAKSGANPITKRALSTFNKAIDEKIAMLSGGRVDRIAADWNSIIVPYTGDGLAAVSLPDLIKAYNRFINTQAASPELQHYSMNRLDVFIGSGRTYRRASIYLRFAEIDGEIKSIYCLDVFPYGGLSATIHKALSARYASRGGVEDADNPYLTLDGYYLRKPITSLEEEVSVLRQIFDLINITGRELIAKEIQTRLTKLASVCGEITASFSDNSFEAFCAAEQMAA